MVAQEDDVINIFVSNDLIEFIRPNGIGSHAWVPLKVTTNLDDVTVLEKNDGVITPITVTDEAEASSYGLNPNEFILWVDASKESQSFTLSDGENINEYHILVTVVQ